MTIKGIPFDAPLYEIDSERGIEYWGCEALAAFFTVAGDVSDLIPAGLRLGGDPAIGGVFLAHYANSNVGEYYEWVSVIQVVGPDGGLGLYVPYIYVTNDAALAAGREVIGAPKKLAHLNIVREYDLIQGTFERPAGKRLATFTMKPNTRMDRGVMEAMLPVGTPMYSIRQLPALPGRDATVELVRWYTDLAFHKCAGGEELLFTGPASITYDSPSIIDPVHRLGIGDMIAAVSTHFDMALRPGGVVDTSVPQREAAATSV